MRHQFANRAQSLRPQHSPVSHPRGLDDEPRERHGYTKLTRYVDKNYTHTQHPLSLNVAELRPLHFKPRINTSSNISNLCSDMLAFSVAVSPYEKNFSAPRLCLNVFCDNPFILKFSPLGLSFISSEHVTRHLTYAIDNCYDRRIKKLNWPARVPLPITVVKIRRFYMSCRTCKNNRTISPGRAEAIVEFIIL